MNAFVVDGHDNGIYSFRWRADVQRCARGGALTRKWEETLCCDAVLSSTADVSASCDGVIVVSDCP